ncbi:hypothetical protein AaE_015216 [Aphanomyces astaci]|uniref:GST N-terminal domain-containing protein n=1 Tax=Aphanomyces astaci TaxID=112090 RepID=A0A6A4YYD3_APHAT|nr:hypothetical protein AaE_015216 [Aphanomyces astaci]
MALSIKGIAYDYDAMDVLARSNERDNYHIVNKSLVKVPSLEIDGQVLNQSSAILEYLDETRPTPSLLPFNVADRALVRYDWGRHATFAVLRMVCRYHVLHR